jgi:Flp pilus assembly pilin Flp
MYNALKRFLSRDDGAVTVDWVILTAAVVGLVIAALPAFRGEVTEVSDATGARLDEYNQNLPY